MKNIISKSGNCLTLFLAALFAGPTIGSAQDMAECLLQCIAIPNSMLTAP